MIPYKPEAQPWEQLADLPKGEVLTPDQVRVAVHAPLPADDELMVAVREAAEKGWGVRLYTTEIADFEAWVREQMAALDRLRNWPTPEQVAERAGVEVEDARDVMLVGREYRWRIGNISGPDPGTRFYADRDLVGTSPDVVDREALVRDAVDLLGDVSEEVARAVVEAENDLL